MHHKDRHKYFCGAEIVPDPLRGDMRATELVENYAKWGAYNAGKLAEAARVYESMLDEGATIALTLAGAMTPAGLGGLVSAAIEAGFVDVIISTGANVYHDLHFALGYTARRGSASANDDELYRVGVERIYDVYITEEMLLNTDAFVREALAKETGRVSSARVHHVLGTVAAHATPRPERSFVATAARHDVPIFTSSPGDSSVGMNIAAMALWSARPEEALAVDPNLDVLLTTAIVWASEKNGVCIVGGGSPKNFYLQTQPTLWQLLGIDKGGHDYAVQVTTDAPHWGGLSGATPNEAVSWGKYKAGDLAKHVVVYSDATIVLPILFSHLLASRPKRQSKRLFTKLDGLFGDLRAAALAAEAEGPTETKRR